MKKLILFAMMWLILGLINISHAVLIDNGGGLIYDSDLNITWYDFTQTGINWADANSWAAGLSVGDVTGWRLPTALNQGDPVPTDYNPSNGYNCTGSELGHLYYTELGNIGFQAPDGSFQTGYGLNNTGPFSELQSLEYWSAEVCFLVQPVQTYAWYFNLSSGYQGGAYQWPAHGTFCAMAVHDGNIAPSPVPEPSTMLLLGAGLVGLVGLRRFKK